MIDCSRNGVLRLHSIYFLLNNMALMGLNMLQLYTEDTYEVRKGFRQGVIPNLS